MGTENLTESWITKTTTCWPIVDGSVDDAVTFESSTSAVDLDSDNQDQPQADPKPPLILRRPSPDSATPCDITLSFQQHHEIKQVYVRSTARVYEIYYSTTSNKADNEYLCTVHCGLAAQNEDLLQHTDAIGSGSLSTNTNINANTYTCVDEPHSLTETGSSSNEDGWVDVKLPHSSALAPPHQGYQDLFEATAQISDADPVLSVTLRLLSIQSGDYIYIDEVYVFADPVVSTDMDSSPNTLGNSSGNTLMSMLVPTLLQLSKSRMNQIREQNHSAAPGRTKHQDYENKSTCAATLEGKQSSMVNGASLNMSEPEVPVQTPDPQTTPYSTSRELPWSLMQRSLDELASRVARIEHFCLRFEENLLKPITSIEARLERVEEQLESFVKNPQFPRTAGTRISAPEFSCSDTEANSNCNDGNEYPGTSKSVDQDDLHHEELSIPPSDVSPSANHVQSPAMPSSSSVSELLPSLVVTAPDFSNVDDEEDNDDVDDEEDKDVAESVSGSPNDRPKKSLSIDDALASALAGFLSSTSTSTTLLECTGKVEEEEEEDAGCPIVEGSWNTSPLQCDEPLLSSDLINVGEETASISCNDLVVKEQESITADNNSEETIEAVGKQDDNIEEEGDTKLAGSAAGNVFYLDMGEREDSGLTGEVRSGEVQDDLSPTSVSCCSDTLTLVSSAPSNDNIDASLVPGGNIDSPFYKEVAKDNSDVLQNILKLPSPRMVDFQAPILDVKFLSLENSSVKSPLEALLFSVPEHEIEVPSVKEYNECSLSEQNGLVMIENEGSTTLETNRDQLCVDNCDSGCKPLNTEKELHDPHKCSSQDMCVSLI